ncbi:hypothetical protein [Dyella sp. A6]|uniref:hypothetical protein n=1 Tax=Dyella aluminiiresistens TaxID=3069105 RepID=UPI002E7847AE|nr:hypothetical protein [Dyella sp. A6]
MFKYRFSLPLLAAFVLSASCLAAPQTTRGDNLLIQRVHQEKSMHLPERGLTMVQVEKRYGAPLRKLQPRGGDTRLHPVINRWEYPRFIVYFQRNRVIHSVLNTPAGNNLHPNRVH